MAYKTPKWRHIIDPDLWNTCSAAVKQNLDNPNFKSSCDARLSKVDDSP
jgi:hypothetical protein